MNKNRKIQKINISVTDPSITKWVKWTRPNFTSNTTWGELTCSSYNSTYYAWRAVDGNYPNTGGGYGNTWETGNSATGWWKWKFAQPLKIRKICIYPRSTSDGAKITKNVTYDLYTYDQLEKLGTYTLLSSTHYPTNWAPFNFETPRILDGIYVYKNSSGDNYCGIGELTLEAEIQETMVSTLEKQIISESNLFSRYNDISTSIKEIEL